MSDCRECHQPETSHKMDCGTGRMRRLGTADAYDKVQQAMQAMRDAETIDLFNAASTDLYTAFMALDKGLKSGMLIPPVAWDASVIRVAGWFPRVDG